MYHLLHNIKEMTYILNLEIILKRLSYNQSNAIKFNISNEKEAIPHKLNICMDSVAYFSFVMAIYFNCWMNVSASYGILSNWKNKCS